ncbi:ferredoxin [Rhodococcoides fascians]|jgi:ferredoxin|uniref:ferredoxin n=1 Tax=Rhodococcoides fascians TaxID=1828 RepID=UPI0005602C70|nr:MULTISPECIES: ferredoxin [Rhodococcus]OZE79205.1 ferredoxin [Rhodococcus sp. 15-649-1-2]OZE96388.1 ferredoxin [Rhodococcus sp. 15-1189-1-1a]OZF10975.1 ferredoxin [Rhodococcus sp. 14-2686-1-2]
MRIDVDWDRCEGHGLCEEAAHEVFSLDDDGELHYAYDHQDVPEGQVAAVRSAIGACPVAALREQK